MQKQIWNRYQEILKKLLNITQLLDLHNKSVFIRKV